MRCCGEKKEIGCGLAALDLLGTEEHVLEVREQPVCPSDFRIFENFPEDATQYGRRASTTAAIAASTPGIGRTPRSNAASVSVRTRSGQSAPSGRPISASTSA